MSTIFEMRVQAKLFEAVEEQGLAGDWPLPTPRCS